MFPRVNSYSFAPSHHVDVPPCTICSGQSKTLVPRDLFWELRLADGGGENSLRSAIPKTNCSKRGSSIDRCRLYKIRYSSRKEEINFNYSEGYDGLDNRVFFDGGCKFQVIMLRNFCYVKLLKFAACYWGTRPRVILSPRTTRKIRC